VGDVVGGAASGLLAGVPALRAFLSPSFRHRREEKWIRLGEIDQFDPEVPTKVDFVDAVRDAWVETRRLRNVWIYTEDGETFRVYNGRCTHLGCNYFLDEEKKYSAVRATQDSLTSRRGSARRVAPAALDTLEVKVEDGVPTRAIRTSISA
jgi:nitrite reductase/ring-hydroxylating ferredoxin subunit